MKKDKDIFDKLTLDEFTRWKINPLTKLFFQYLNDNITHERERLSQILAEGIIPEMAHIENVAFTQRVVNNINNVTHNDINSLYIENYVYEEIPSENASGNNPATYY